MTTMKINVYKFNPAAEDLAESVIEQVKARLPRELTEMVGGTASEQLWDKGYYDSMGYRYFLDEADRRSFFPSGEIPAFSALLRE